MTEYSTNFYVIIIFAQALSATMRAWGVCLPYTVDPYLASPGYAGDATKSEQLRAFWTGYEAITEGCLFSGAGGGFLMCISEVRFIFM